MLMIDGSYGEGGGQVLRTALGLAILTGQPVRIERIRAGRPKPGLQPQHLTAVRAAAAVCAAHLEGDTLDSQTLTFIPGSPASSGEYTFDVAEAARGGSAGSVSLVLQTVLLPLALAQGESHLTLRGGTHVPWAPSVSYLEHVFLPALAWMGVRVQIELVRWGFYPAGGGEIRVRIEGRGQGSGGVLSPIVLTGRGELRRIWGMAVVMNLPAHIPQRMAARARNVLAGEGLRAYVEPRRLRGAGPGAGIFLFAEYGASPGGGSITAGFTAYGRKGHHRSNAPTDVHLADQLVLPMALAREESCVVTSQMSRHLLTNIWAVRQFMTRRLSAEEEPGGRVVVRCDALSKRLHAKVGESALCLKKGRGV